MKQTLPFSDNIVFWDTEFTGFDVHNGEILSIGMVKMNGEELYLEIDYPDGIEVNDWVRKNLLPELNGPKVSREEAVKRIMEFIGHGNPYLVAYVDAFDVPYLYKLLQVDDSKTNKTLPFNWIQIDFASILFAYGYSPEELTTAKRERFCKELGIETSGYKEHHALDDAKFLRDAYLALIESRNR